MIFSLKFKSVNLCVFRFLTESLNFAVTSCKNLDEQQENIFYIPKVYAAASLVYVKFLESELLWRYEMSIVLEYW